MSSSGRFRVTVNDREIIDILAGIGERHRGMFIEQALIFFAQTRSGKDALRVYRGRNNKSTPANTNRKRVPDHENQSQIDRAAGAFN